MKKYRFDSFELRLIVRALDETKEEFSVEEENGVYDLIIGLIDVYDSLNGKQKAKIVLTSSEKRILRKSLISFYNRVITSGCPADDLVNILLLLNGY